MKFLSGLLASAAIALSATTALAQEPIKIGEINHYKRMAAFAGPYKQGIELALGEVNGAGGVLGRPLEFTYMQASMLAEQAAKTDAVKYATIAPNYAYGKDAVAAFKKALTALKPDVEFVTEQWPALFKIDAGAEVQAIERAKPDAIYNVTFGGDLAKFVREGTTRGVFDGRNVYGLLTGEPEYLEPLADEAPEGWVVTGYPWYDVSDDANKAFVDAYQAAYDTNPKIGSLVGYMTVQSIAAGIARAGSTDTEALVAAFKGLEVNTPVGKIEFREQDHQATMGAFVGTVALKDGKGVMVDWDYKEGADYLPSDEEVAKLRPAE